MSDGREIFVFDFEATGNDPRRDRPVQIGLLRGLEQPEEVMNLLVNPHMPIHPEAEKVHGISAEMVAGSSTYVKGLHTMLSYLYPHIKPDGAGGLIWPLLVGYNSTQYDTVMADTCYQRPVFSAFPQLDVLDVLYRYANYLPKRTLSVAYKHFTGKDLEGAHGAVEDCYGTAVVLREVCRREGVTVDYLAQELRTPRVYDIMPIGKHSGKQICKVPKGWAWWMRKNATGMRPDLLATIQHITNR